MRSTHRSDYGARHFCLHSVDRWTPDVHRAAFLGALDKQLDEINLPPQLEQDYATFIQEMDPFEFPPLVATLFTRLGYTDVSTLTTRPDEGVDVLARYSAKVIKFNVGISCHHCSDPTASIGPNSVKSLRAALPRQACQAGLVVTNGTFTAAAQRQQVSDAFVGPPVRCIDGPSLARLLFSNLVGLDKSSGGEYLVVPHVLDQQFIRGRITRTLSSLYIPQADNLELVKTAVRLVSEGVDTPAAVGKEFGYAPRQGHYYATAAEALGLLRLDPHRRLVLTKDGQRLVRSTTRRGATTVLRKSIRKIPVYERMLAIMRARSPIQQEALLSEWVAISGLTESTAKRRLTTMLRWFEELELITRGEGGEISAAGAT